MTLEAYINGALSFRINNWIPTAQDQTKSDGRLISGEWLELIAHAERFKKDGDRWYCFYRIEASIPSALRLVRANLSFSMIENPNGYVKDGGDYIYKSGGTGPVHLDDVVKLAVTDGHDNHHWGSDDTSWRSVFRLYFVRITHLILRDPTAGNLIMRFTGNGNILIDA